MNTDMGLVLLKTKKTLIKYLMLTFASLGLVYFVSYLDESYGIILAVLILLPCFLIGVVGSLYFTWRYFSQRDAANNQTKLVKQQKQDKYIGLIVSILITLIFIFLATRGIKSEYLSGESLVNSVISQATNITFTLGGIIGICKFCWDIRHSKSLTIK